MPKFKTYGSFTAPSKPKIFNINILIGGEASRKVSIAAADENGALSKALDLIAPNRIKPPKESEE